MKRSTARRLVVATVGVVLGVTLSAADEPTGVPVVPRVNIRADAERREVVVTVESIEIPAATPYSHHAPEGRMRFTWPVGGWIRGYRIELFDAEGRLLPRQMLHHAGVFNPERRQLAYPLVERLLAAGRETRAVMLPESIGIPLSAGQNLLMYYALVNPTDQPMQGVTLKLTVAWTPDRAKTTQSMFPLNLDANPKTPGGSRSFDVPSGVSAMSAEFTLPAAGHLRGMGGHLHDYAVEIRLEDVVTGKVLARLKTKRHADGRLISVDTTRFLFKRRGLRLAANHPYRVVAVYNNPTSETIPDGAMAFLAGLFVPDDMANWPAIDTSNETYQKDLDDILGKNTHAHVHGK